MATRAVTVGAASGTAGISGEAGLAGVPRLLEDLARLSEDKDTADIVFLLGRDETPVYAHRIILQARSVSFIGRFSWYASINLVFLAHNIPVDPRENTWNSWKFKQWDNLHYLRFHPRYFFTASRDEANKFDSFL